MTPRATTKPRALFKKYPDLKVIIAPTTVGIAASARAVQDANLVGKVFVTGLGTPNQMREYVKSGAAPQFALWNPGDLGYLAIYTLNAIATGKIKGQPGDKFTAGKLGEYTITETAPSCWARRPSSTKTTSILRLLVSSGSFSLCKGLSQRVLFWGSPQGQGREPGG